MYYGKPKNGIQRANEELISELESLLSKFMEGIKDKPYEQAGTIKNGLAQTSTWVENSLDFLRIIDPFVAHATEGISNEKVRNGIKAALEPTITKYRAIFKEYNTALIKNHEPEFYNQINSHLQSRGLTGI